MKVPELAWYCNVYDRAILANNGYVYHMNTTSFRELPFSVEIPPLWLKHIYSIFSALT